MANKPTPEPAEERDMDEIAEFCFDNALRVDYAFHNAFQGDQYSNEVEEFFEDLSDADEFNDLLQHEHPGVSIMRESDFEDDIGGDEIGEIFARMARRGIFGFFVCAQTPVPFDISADRTSYTSHGFGYTQVKWFFTKNFDSAFADRLKAWQRSIVDEVWEKESKDKNKS